MESSHNVFLILMLYSYSMFYTQVQSLANCGGAQNRYVCDISDPQAFHICLGDDKHSLKCPGTLHFNAQSQICDWPEATLCPYDNYSGMDDDLDEGSDMANNENHQVHIAAKQSMSSAAADEPHVPRVRINPYSNLPKKMYHGHDPENRVSKAIQSAKRVSAYGNGNYPKKLVKGRRRKVFVHGARNSVATQDAQNDDSDVHNKYQMTISKEKTTHKEGTHGEGYDGDKYSKKRVSTDPRKTLMPGYTSNESVQENVWGAGVEHFQRKNAMYGKQETNKHVYNLKENHDYGPGDDNETPRKLQKNEGRYRKIQGKNSSKQHFASHHMTDYAPKRPKSMSPFAPPYEAYNIYSHLKRQFGDNELREKQQASQKHRQRKKETSYSAQKNNKRWYQQSHMSNPINELNELHSVAPTPMGTRSINKNKKEQKAVPNWINSYIGNRNNIPETNKEKARNRYDTDTDRDRTRGNTKSQNSLIPGRDIDSKRGYNQGKIIPSTGLVEKTSLHSSDFYKKIDSETDKKMWMPSDLSSARRPVWHPRVRPYRRLPLSEFMEDATFVSSKSTAKEDKEIDGDDNGPFYSKNKQLLSRMESLPVMSAHGNIIHPYRPQQSDTAEVPSPPKYSNPKTSYSNRKINSYSPKFSKNRKRGGKCSSSWCQLPDCRCVGSDIPGGLSRGDVPQMVILTFDDGVNTVNFPFYKQIFDGSLRNPNGCPAKSTFFVSGDSTDYDLVKQLTKSGHEIASHTLSHRSPTTWWAHAGVENWEKEVVGMRNRLVKKSNIPHDNIQGMRAPFLQVGGDDQYTMLHNNKFRYDSSMVTGSLQKNDQPPIWPFTLDTPPNHDTCNLTPCPNKVYPGLWELPLIRWYGKNGVACAMPDACYTGYGYKGTMAFLEDNFQRHYKSNRAPLGIFIHASWFKRKTENFEALKDFLSSILKRKAVWLLTASQVLDWMERPVPISSLDRIDSWKC